VTRQSFADEGNAQAPVRVLGVVASPHGRGTTAHALGVFLDGCTQVGAVAAAIDLDGGVRTDDAVKAINDCDAVVFATPTYRATYTSLLGSLLERIDRDRASGSSAALAGKATAIVMTAAASEHFLATSHLAQMLTCFFGAQLLSPPLFFDRSALTSAGELCEKAQGQAQLHGRALVDLALACRTSEHIPALDPLV